MRAALTALALLGLLALAAGCGGGDSDSSATSASGGSAPATTTGDSTTATQDGGGPGAGGENGGGGEDGGPGSEASGPSGPGLAEKAKPDVKGFQAPPGGDDSIQTFGEEPESTEEEEIIAAMAEVEMWPTNQVSVRLTIACRPLFSINGSASIAIAL